MFILQVLRSSNRKYINTGIYDSEVDFGPLSVCDFVLGEVPVDIEEACLRLLLTDPTDNNKADYIEKQLAVLKNVKLADLKPLAYVSVVTLLFKFGFYLAKTKKDAARYDAFVNKHVHECWENYRIIFQTILMDEVNTDLLSEYVSRFAHFYQIYQAISKLTKRNERHAEKMAGLLLACLIKHIPSIEPFQIGRRYYLPKMVREVILAMLISYPKNKDMKNHAFTVLTISYDYFNSIRIYEEKRSISDYVLGGKRQQLDMLIEKGLPQAVFNKTVDMEDPKIKRLRTLYEDKLIDKSQESIISDLSKIAMINNFGTEKIAAYGDKDGIHIKIIIANEVRSGILVVLIYDKTIDIMQVPLDIGALNDNTIRLYEAVINDKRQDIIEWHAILKVLLPEHITNKIIDVINRHIIRHVYIYPDGCMWYMPWCYLITKMLEGKTNAIPSVSIKISTKNIATKLTVNRAYFLGAWEYDASNKTSTRRGDNEADNLHYVKDELLALADIWLNNGRQSTYNIECDADDILRYVSENDAPKLVHVACHGDTQINRVPKLILNSRNKMSHLHYEKILRANWAGCELVFINACFGGACEPFVGGPAIGLLEALSIAGVKRLIAPLWPIDDRYASKFAQEYYVELLKCGDYLDAFRTSILHVSDRSSSSDVNNAFAYNFYTT